MINEERILCFPVVFRLETMAQSKMCLLYKHMLMVENGSRTWDVLRGKAEDKLEMLVTLLGLATELEGCLPTRKTL